MRTIILSALLLGIAFCPTLAQPAASPDTTQKTAAPAEAPALAVDRMAFCTAVENREPSGEASEFPPTVGKLCFWSEVTGSNEPITVAHVWYYDDKQVCRVELPVKYPRARIWSTKTISAGMTGTWKVEVITADNQKLSEKTCAVK